MSNSKEQSDMRILKKAACPTISSKSKITYHIGATPDNEIYFRIHANTGGGFMSQEWVSLKDILDVFGEVQEGQPITSFVLQPLFQGKSVNTPAFLVAALADEKLLRLLKGKKRGHVVMDPEGFNARMKKLMSSSPAVASKGTAKRPSKKAVTKKAAVKKRAIAKRKKATTSTNTTTSA